jgi:hypothetical protein
MKSLEGLMADKKTEDKTETDGCNSCGDERVMLTEERNAVPRCAGCGKALDQHTKQ